MSTSAFEYLGAALAEAWKPPPRYKVSEWADARRQLVGRASDIKGQWQTSRTPYLRKIMDALSPDSPYEHVDFMKGSQLGATEVGLNWLGFTIDWDPAPMLIVYPTVEAARRQSRQRISAMIESTPEIAAKITVASRDAGNSTFEKIFPGGIMQMTGANSAIGLKGMPVERIFLDELDEYPDDVQGQGDPRSMVEKRSSNFARRKMYTASTPTVSEISKIEQQMKLGDWQRYFLPCPFCGHWDYLQWRIGGWTGRDGRHHHVVFDNVTKDPASARFRCGNEACDRDIDEREKRSMLERGEWRATKLDGRPGRIGFHLPGLYSPLGWRALSTVVEEFLIAEQSQNELLLKAWVQQVLAETWKPRGEQIEISSLLERDPAVEADVPHGVGVLVAAVDVQVDRLEAIVRGFGPGDRSWLIDFEQMGGDPATSAPWEKLDAFLAKDYVHESGQRMRILCGLIDSGFETERVYRYCATRMSGGVTWSPGEGIAELEDEDQQPAEHRRVQIFPAKGSGELGMPLIGRPSRRNRYRLPLWLLCVDSGKDIIAGRLRIPRRPGDEQSEGYMNFPRGRVDREYVAQLANERALRKYDPKRGVVRRWEKIREHLPNEAFDLEVMALAAFSLVPLKIRRDLARRAERFSQAPDAGTAPLVGSAPPPPARRGGRARSVPLRRRSWVKGGGR